MKDDIQKLHSQNAMAWDEATAQYEIDFEGSLALIKEGGNNLRESELKYLAPILSGCRKAIHLQCAGGLDTLSLWRLGASEVVGIDISPRMVELAKKLSDACAAPATFLKSDVLGIPEQFDGSADLVYTGKGSLFWLHDLDAWAGTVCRLLKAGGYFYIFEGHPMTWLFRQDEKELTLDPEFKGYFSKEVYSSKGWSPSYITKQLEERKQNIKHERHWNLGDVVGCLLKEGFEIKALEEHSESFWKEFPDLDARQKELIPHTFSILARK